MESKMLLTGRKEIEEKTKGVSAEKEGREIREIEEGKQKRKKRREKADGGRGR